MDRALNPYILLPLNLQSPKTIYYIRRANWAHVKILYISYRPSMDHFGLWGNVSDLGI